MEYFSYHWLFHKIKSSLFILMESFVMMEKKIKLNNEDFIRIKCFLLIRNTGILFNSFSLLNPVYLMQYVIDLIVDVKNPVLINFTTWSIEKANNVPWNFFTCSNIRQKYIFYLMYRWFWSYCCFWQANMPMKADNPIRFEYWE